MAEEPSRELHPLKYLETSLIMCMIMHVTTQTPALGSPYLRRRVIVELTPQELPLLEEAERRHGTKRQAIVSALEMASRGVELEQELAEAQAELVRLEAEFETLRTDQAVGEPASSRKREASLRAPRSPRDRAPEEASRDSKHSSGS
jgi:hypothetical protein